MSKGFTKRIYVEEGYVDIKQYCRFPHDGKEIDNLSGPVKTYWIKTKEKDEK